MNVNDITPHHKPMTKEQLELRNNLALNIKFMNNNQSEEEEYYGGRQLQ